MENNKEETHDNYDDKNYETVLEENVQESVGNETTEEEENTNENDIPEITIRSGRRVTRPTRYTADEGYNYFLDELDDKIEKITEYDCFEVKVIGTSMMHYQQTWENKFSFIHQYELMKGLNIFCEKVRQAALKEVKQLHDRKVFEPISIDGLTKFEKERAMESIAFLTEKRNKTIKARMCANGSTQREYIDRDDAASPTTSTDSILITSVIDAKQGRDVMTVDVQNAFVQCKVNQINGERIVMKIRGALVDILVDLDQ